MVLPLPEGPSRTRISPRGISSDSGPTATVCDHCLRTSSSVTNALIGRGSASRSQSTSATFMTRRTSRAHGGSESTGRSSRAGNRYAWRVAASCAATLPTYSTNARAWARWRAFRATPIASSITGVPLFGNT